MTSQEHELLLHHHTVEMYNAHPEISRYGNLCVSLRSLDAIQPTGLTQLRSIALRGFRQYRTTERSPHASRRLSQVRG